MAYKAVIFDFFGVFVPDVYPAWLLANSESLKSSHEELIKLSQQADAGKLPKKDFLEALGEASGKTPEQVETELNNFSLDPRVVKLMHKLSENYKIALLCNASSEIIDPVMNETGMKSFFDVVVVSSEAGMAKPNPEIYKLTLKRLSVDAQESVFIDDRIDNINGAEEVGIPGVHYRDFDQLLAELQKLGIS